MAKKKKKRHYSDNYSNMINHDYSNAANLPQNVIIKNYPEEEVYGTSYEGDSISGIDKQRKEDKPR